MIHRFCLMGTALLVTLGAWLLLAVSGWGAALLGYAGGTLALTLALVLLARRP